jgi:hypothetical protein
MATIPSDNLNIPGIENYQIMLTIDQYQIEVIKKIRDAIDDLHDKFKDFPVSFGKIIEGDLNRILDIMEDIDSAWKLWVLEKFQRDLSSTQFMEGVKIKPLRKFHWDD